MDPFVYDLMEQVFKKGEDSFDLDRETKDMMDKIREKIKSTTTHHRRKSSNTEEFLLNMKERIIFLIENESDIQKRKSMIDNYIKISSSRSVLKSLCG